MFAVDCRNCGGCLGGRSGGLERWWFSEFCGGFWGEFVDSGTGNFGWKVVCAGEWRFGVFGVDSGSRQDGGVLGWMLDNWVRIGEEFGRVGGVWRSDGWEKGVGFFQKEKEEDSG